ncbi:uncharacterized protein LOC143412466 isoform X2 [Maylandia zebra]|uniref:uncharacterized protein LOC143412466 isoform X2 n=1 Tax=Maylandia zebra TaxID=106582 RepID=UPI00403D2E2D
MDSADSNPVQRELSVQGEVLDRHESMMKHIMTEQTAMRQVLANIQGMLLTAPGTSAKNPQPTPSVSVAAACPLPPSPPPPPPRREHTLPVPEKFDGDITKSRGFLMQCSLIFRQQTQAYGSDCAKITLMVELMTGRALQWAQAVLNVQPNISYQDFLTKFLCVFDKGTDADGAANRLFTLKQGHKSVADFSIDFWILAEETGWAENALRGAFLNCLNEELKHELATKELPKPLSTLINMCIQLDNHMREFGRRADEERRLAGGADAPTGLLPSHWREEEEDPAEDEEQPMQLGRAWFGASHRRRRQRTDDILVFSRSPAEHVEHVRLVLQRLLENRLFVKAEKCEFHVPTVSFLGFVVEQGRLRADPGKVKAVVEWPVPKNRRELQKFLGFANFYRRFIRNFGWIALPLTALTSPMLLFQWSLDAQRAFGQLKALFSSAPVLVQADLELPFFVEVDASDSGVGAVLSQRVAGMASLAGGEQVSSGGVDRPQKFGVPPGCEAP